MLRKIGQGRNKEAGKVKINKYCFLTSTRKRGTAGAVLHGITLATSSSGHYSCFSGLIANLTLQLLGPSLFYIPNMQSLHHFPTLITPYLYRFFPFLPADGRYDPVFFKEKLDHYYSGTTNSCLRVIIYFCTNFSHQNI